MKQEFNFPYSEVNRDNDEHGLDVMDQEKYEDFLSDLFEHDSSYKNHEGNIEGKIEETNILLQYTKA